MKRVITSIWCVVATLLVFAQAPQSMDFQSIIRDSKGNLVTNQAIGLRISILKGGISGTAVYSETHNATTNNGGLVTITIGKGTTSNDFAAIEWGKGTYFIKTEVDVTGGTNYTLSATNQMLSVPYALYANKAGDYDNKLIELEKKLDSVKVAVAQRDTLTSSEFEEIKQKLVTDMTFTITKNVVKLTDSTIITADPLPWHTTKVTWKSFDESVANVNNGIVHPVNAGEVKVSATSGTVTKSGTVYVILTGEFSVSASKKVRFSHGNLYYSGNIEWPAGYTNTYTFTGGNWGICANQFEVVNGCSLRTDYCGSCTPLENRSWKSRTNIIGINGTWEELTMAEWKYLLQTRSNCNKLYSIATVNTIQGLIILPDTWNLPTGLSFTARASSYSTNMYTTSQWTILQKAGAVFLPYGRYIPSDSFCFSSYSHYPDLVYFTFSPSGLIFHDTFSDNEYSNAKGYVWAPKRIVHTCFS